MTVTAALNSPKVVSAKISSGIVLAVLRDPDSDAFVMIEGVKTANGVRPTAIYPGGPNSMEFVDRLLSKAQKSALGKSINAHLSAQKRPELDLPACIAAA